MADLVIHPSDITTDFLIESYRHSDFNVVNDNCSKSQIRRYIKDHNRIIIMGHGGNIGLLGYDKIMLDSSCTYYLRSKKNNVYVWCNADEFVKKNRLKGFATGMIISEFEEAINYCVNASLDQINESNLLFAKALEQSLMLPPHQMKIKMLEIYTTVDNPVILFNRENLYVFQ